MAANVVASLPVEQQPVDFRSFTVPKLKDYLAKRGVSVTGYLKDKLLEICTCVQRLQLPVDPDCTSSGGIAGVKLKWEAAGCKKDPFTLSYTDDVSDSPNFSLLDLFNYLICSRADYDRRALAAYKSFDDFRLYFDGHVKSLQFCSLSSEESLQPLCAYKAEVQPAQRDKTFLKKPFYSLWILMDKDAAEVRAAHCECLGG